MTSGAELGRDSEDVAFHGDVEVRPRHRTHVGEPRESTDDRAPELARRAGNKDPHHAAIASCSAETTASCCPAVSSP